MVGGTGLPGNNCWNCFAYWRLPTRRRAPLRRAACRVELLAWSWPAASQVAAAAGSSGSPRIVGHRLPLLGRDHPLRDRDDLDDFAAQVHLQLEHALVGIGQLFADGGVGRRAPSAGPASQAAPPPVRDLADVERTGRSALLELVPQELVFAFVMRVKRGVEIGEPGPRNWLRAVSPAGAPRTTAPARIPTGTRCAGCDFATMRARRTMMRHVGSSPPAVVAGHRGHEEVPACVSESTQGNARGLGPPVPGRSEGAA